MRRLSPRVQQLLHAIFFIHITLGYFLYVWQTIFWSIFLVMHRFLKLFTFFSHRNINIICFTCHIRVRMLFLSM